MLQVLYLGVFLNAFNVYALSREFITVGRTYRRFLWILTYFFSILYEIVRRRNTEFHVF